MRTILRRLVLGSTLVVLSAAMGSAPTASESDPVTSEASVAPLPAAPPAANPVVSLTFTGAGPFETTAFVLVVTGIALSLVAAFGLHQAERAVRTADDVTRTMRVPFLGHVPLGPKSHAARRTCFPPPELIPVYQNLRTTLVFTAEERPTRLMALAVGRRKDSVHRDLSLFISPGHRVIYESDDWRAGSAGRSTGLRATDAGGNGRAARVGLPDTRASRSFADRSSPAPDGRWARAARR